MLTKDFVHLLQRFNPEKHVIVLMAHMDPFYYDSADTEANSVIVVTDDEGSIFEVVETDETNDVIHKMEVISTDVPAPGYEV